MKILLSYFLKLFLFLFAFFVSEQIIFFLFRTGTMKGISFSEILMSFVHAASMNLASCCTVLLIPFILFSVYIFYRHTIFEGIYRSYMRLILILSAFINACDIALYETWGTRINQKAISYLVYPKEALSTVWSLHYLFLLIVLIIQCFIFIRLFNKYFAKEIPVDAALSKKISWLLFMPFILIVGLRGGFQTFPLDKSWVYFSRHTVLNQAAVNSSWNFIHAITDPAALKENPYNYFTSEKAKSIIRELNKQDDDSSVSILNTKRPNIVLIMLESMSAEVMEPLGGKKGIAPNFTELAKEGLLFTNFYTPGFRTEQGLAALVSGFPSQPTTTIIRQFGKFDRMPGLPHSLDSIGYTSSYYYGGNLHFAFTGSYLQAMGFDKIIGEDDFKFIRRTKWGAYDEELFSFFNADMKNTKEPFFSIIMSATNHEPFDADVEKIVPGKTGDWCDDYINTVHYTDKCLAELMNGMKKQAWHNNTLVVIVADHAHSCPSKFEYNSAPRHRIPFLLMGGALKPEYRGQINNRIASQVDFPATILAMLQLNHDKFHWSKNIFGNHKPYAFYSFDEGFGWITDRQQLAYDQKLKKIILVKNDSISTDENNRYLDEGKSYLQLLIDEYMQFNEK
jgi:phosphoglycerol transferase MdoB-like AlkP superfamily enzyme